MSDIGMGTRALLEASWHAAKRRADVTGAYVGTAASVAGQYLDLAHGNATRAVAMLPDRDGEFWARVASLLLGLAAEERDVHRAMQS